MNLKTGSQYGSLTKYHRIYGSCQCNNCTRVAIWFSQIGIHWWDGYSNDLNTIYCLVRDFGCAWKLLWAQDGLFWMCRSWYFMVVLTNFYISFLNAFQRGDSLMASETNNALIECMQYSSVFFLYIEARMVPCACHLIKILLFHSAGHASCPADTQFVHL